jgi:hypothetical protein
MQYLTAQGANEGQQQNIMRQQALVNQLRQNAATPQMRGGGGRVQTAAHPLEFLSSVLGQGMAAKGQADVNTQADNLQGQQRSDLANMIEQQRQAKAYAALGKDPQGNPMGGGGSGFQMPPSDPMAYAGGM